MEYGKSEIIDKNWFDTFLPESIRDKEKIFFKKLMSGEARLSKYHETQILTKSGVSKTVGWYNTKLKDESGKIIGLLILGEDITKWKKLELILAERVKELQCFYAISEIRERPHITLDELYIKASHKVSFCTRFDDVFYALDC